MTRRVLNPRAIPARNSSPYKAGAYLFAYGPKSQDDLFAAIPFGARASARAENICRALDSGWLVELHDGRLDCGDDARAHYGDEPEPSAKTKRVGQIAAPRIVNLMNRPAWRSNLNPRGTRPDVPEWSHRAGVTFFTQA